MYCLRELEIFESGDQSSRPSLHCLILESTKTYEIKSMGKQTTKPAKQSSDNLVFAVEIFIETFHEWTAYPCTEPQPSRQKSWRIKLIFSIYTGSSCHLEDNFENRVRLEGNRNIFGALTIVLAQLFLQQKPTQNSVSVNKSYAFDVLASTVFKWLLYSASMRTLGIIYRVMVLRETGNASEYEPGSELGIFYLLVLIPPVYIASVPVREL